MNIVRESIKPVIENSIHVNINQENLEKFAKETSHKKINHWYSISPFDINKLTLNDKISYAFVLNSISFSYWGEPNWNVVYNNKIYNGAKAMMACIGRAIENNTLILDPQYLSGVNEEDLSEILQGSIEIPLFNERKRILNELESITLRYNGFDEIIRKADGDILRLSEIICDTYPSFQDYTYYSGKKAYFNKRSQLLAADIGHILNIEHNALELTACADYKIPQVLRNQNILEYCDDLAKMIDEKKELDPQCDEVIEIRANTIKTVDMIAEMTGSTPNRVNDYLWLLSQDIQDQKYHRTRTTAY